MSTNGDDFFKEQQRAVERMREISRKSRFDNLSAPHFVAPRSPRGNAPENIKSSEKNTARPLDFLGGFDLPFLNGIAKDSDISLVLGLILILSAESSDKLLLCALLYVIL